MMPSLRALLRTGGMAAVLAVIACSDPQSSGEGLDSNVEQVDGVMLITLPARALSHIITSAAPASYQWTADGNSSLQQLGFAIDAARLADGRVVVLDAMSDLLHVLSADGELIGTWGGHREGPDRFQAVTRLITWGDSLAVIDQGGIRPSQIDQAGLITRGALPAD